MAFTLEQLDFLQVHIALTVSPELLENKKRQKEFSERRAQFDKEHADLSAVPAADAVRQALVKADQLAKAGKDFVGALEQLEQAEVLVKLPPLPPTPASPPVAPAAEKRPAPPSAEAVPPVPPPISAATTDALKTPSVAPQAAAPKASAPAVSAGAPGIGKAMQRRLQAADKDFFQRRLAAIEPAYQSAIQGKSPAVKKLKEHYAAAKKAESASKWSEGIDFIGRIEGLLQAIESEKKQLDVQKAQCKRLGNTMGKVKSITFPAGAADQFKKENLKPGKEFEKFLKELKKFEKEKTRPNLETMVKAARAYLKHLAAMPEEEQLKSKRPRKKQICLAQLKAAAHWKLADEYESLGDPPWDFEKENKAGGIYAQMLFEESDKPGKALGSEGGVTASWWVDEVSSFDYDKGTDAVSTNQTRKMIFKSMDGEQGGAVPGFEPGMSAPREIVAKVLNDEIRGMTGMDAGVCPTFLVSMNNDRLNGPDDKPDATKRDERVGSVQQLAANDGALGKRNKQDPTFAKKVSKKNFDEMVTLDMFTLNLDRHAGNLLVKDNPDGTANLIPIDHGYCFPPPESLKDAAARKRLGPPQNVLMAMPQAQEPFSPEALQSIDMLDPDAIAASMKAAAANMSKTTPEAKGMVSDESIEASRRSALLLKRGARELTPADLNAALRLSMDELLDAPAKKLDQTIDAIIQKAKKRRADREDCKELISFPADLATRDAYRQNLAALGWEVSRDLAEPDKDKLPGVFEEHPEQISKILRGRILHPAAQKKIDARLKLLGSAAPLPQGFDTWPVDDRIKWLDGEIRKLNQKPPGDDAGAEPPKRSGAEASKIIAKYSKRLDELAGYFDAFKNHEKKKPEELATALGWFELFEKEGGFAEAARLDVPVKGMNLKPAVQDLRKAKEFEGALQAADKVSPDAARRQQTAFVTQLAADFSAELKRARSADAQAKFAPALQKAQQALQAGGADAAQAVLEPLVPQLRKLVKDEAGEEESCRKEWARFDTDLKQVPDGPALQAYKQKFAAELKGIDPLLAKAAFAEARKTIQTLTQELDPILKSAPAQPQAQSSPAAPPQPSASSPSPQGTAQPAQPAAPAAPAPSAPAPAAAPTGPPWTKISGVENFFLSAAERKGKVEKLSEEATALLNLIEQKTKGDKKAKAKWDPVQKSLELVRTQLLNADGKAQWTEDPANKKSEKDMEAVFKVFMGIVAEKDKQAKAIKELWIDDQKNRLKSELKKDKTSNSGNMAQALGEDEFLEMAQMAELFAKKSKVGFDPYKSGKKLKKPMEMCEVAAIYGYSTQDFTRINGLLRADPAKRNQADEAKLKPYIEACEAGLKKLPKFDGAEAVRCDKSHHKSVVDDIIKTGVRTEKGFMSTGLKKVPGFGDVETHITGITTGKEITMFSLHEKEGEVLFPPGSKFKFVKYSSAGATITDHTKLAGVVDENTSSGTFWFTQIS